MNPVTKTSLTEPMLEKAKDGIMSELGEGIPIAGTVFASIAGLMVAIKIFKRITGART